MVDVSALRAELARNGYTQKKIAEKIGIAPKTFATKMKKGVFGTDEVDIIIKELNISEPSSIFFAQCVTLKDTKCNNM